MEILNTKEAACFLKISERTLRRWVLEFGLPYIQIKKRGKLLFYKEDIMAWLAKRHKPVLTEIKIQRIKNL